MKLLAIKHLLLARSMPRAVEFWTQTFGLQVQRQDQWWAELTWGSATLALHSGGDGSRNPTDLSLQVDNIVAACRVICQHGGRVVAPPEKRPEEPIVMAVFQDTEGNEVMVTQQVAAS
jgi:predicted enzyme related to lactoylglutathione lyase